MHWKRSTWSVITDFFDAESCCWRSISSGSHVLRQDINTLGPYFPNGFRLVLHGWTQTINFSINSPCSELIQSWVNSVMIIWFHPWLKFFHGFSQNITMLDCQSSWEAKGGSLFMWREQSSTRWVYGLDMWGFSHANLKIYNQYNRTILTSLYLASCLQLWNYRAVGCTIYCLVATSRSALIVLPLSDNNDSQAFKCRSHIVVVPRGQHMQQGPKSNCHQGHLF